MKEATIIFKKKVGEKLVDFNIKIVTSEGFQMYEMLKYAAEGLYLGSDLTDTKK